MSINLKLSHQAAILIGIPLIFQIAFVSTLSHWLNAAENEAQSQSRGRSLIAQSAELGKMLQDAGLLLYTYKFSKSEIFNKRYEDIVVQVPMQLSIVKQLAGNENLQSMPIRALETAVNESLWVMQHNHRHLKNKTAMSEEVLLMWQRSVLSSRKVMAAIPLVQRMAKTSETDAAEQRRSILFVQNILVGSVTFNVILAILLAFFFVRGTNKRLSVLMDNSLRLVAGQELLPVLQGSDEPAKLDSVFHQMAQRLKEAQEQERAIVEQERRHREEIDKLKQEFVAMISHDLRTPLMCVQTDLFLLSEGVAGTLPEKAMKHVADAEKNTEYLISLITNLLDVEKLSAGKLELKREEFSVSDLCDRVAEAVNTLAAKKHIKIETNSDEIIVNADPGRITQVLVNLIANAIKFSPENSTITVSARENENEVEVRVEDQGRGIPEEQRTKVFDRFHQVKSDEDTKVHKGTGLGLAICKSLIEEHGGTIGVDGAASGGSIFWFRIPK